MGLDQANFGELLLRGLTKKGVQAGDEVWVEVED